MSSGFRFNPQLPLSRPEHEATPRIFQGNIIRKKAGDFGVRKCVGKARISYTWAQLDDIIWHIEAIQFPGSGRYYLLLGEGVIGQIVIHTQVQGRLQ